MSSLLDLSETNRVCEMPATKPVDERLWQAWLVKGRERDLRSRGEQVWAVKWVSIGVLLTAACLWSHVMPYDGVVRFIVAAGAIVMMFQAAHTRHYAFATGFGAVALLFNPVAPMFSFTGDWQRGATLASAVPFAASLGLHREAKMTALGVLVARPSVKSIVVFGLMSGAALSQDLSKYRDFQFGSDLPAVAKQAAISPSGIKVVHGRPVLIQQLQWRPQTTSWSSKAEAAQDVVFSFYEGKLFRITVNYDRYEIEGLTVEDLIDAISLNYGVATKAQASSARASYGDQEEIVARWQDAKHRFELIRSSYGPTFRLVGVLMPLEAPAQAATQEATRLDALEAPQRDAARVAGEEESARAKLEKARLANKPKFRP